MTRLTRRAFLAALLAAVAATLTGSWLLFYRNRAPAAVIAELIRRRLSYLTIDPDDLALFAREYVARSGSRYRRGIMLAAVFGPLFYSLTFRRLLPRFQGFRAEILSFERHVVARFLLSTNFLQQRSDMLSVTYIAYQDPYELGCGNPLFQLESPDTELLFDS